MGDGVFAVIGGDMRSAHAARLLLEKGKQVWTSGIERAALAGAPPSCKPEQAAERADYCILPVPVSDGGENLRTPLSETTIPLGQIIDRAGPNTVLFAGKIPPWAAQQAARRKVRLLDYAERPDFQRRNAALTAEGALAILLQAMPRALAGARVLVLGFGKTAQSTALLLRAAGAWVSICARKAEARAHAQSLGFPAAGFAALKDRKWTGEPDAVVNTVPAPVLTERELQLLRRDCFVLDLASAPGGVDFKAAEKLGLQAQLAPSLPGRIAPESAGEVIVQTVLTMIEEGGDAQ